MSKEVYEPWSPANSAGAQTRLKFEGMNWVDSTLAIELSETSGAKKKAILIFSELPSLIKITNESFRLKSLRRLPDTRDGSLYIVKDSELLASFHEDSLGIYTADVLMHLVVLTDEWIDLIVSELPQLVYKAGE